MTIILDQARPIGAAAIVSRTDEAAARFTVPSARRCPACDADRPEPLFDNRMAPIAGIDFGYTVVACSRCGMAYASHSPDEQTLEHYYRCFSKYDHPRSIREIDAGDLHRAEVAAAFTRRVLGPKACVLDVGCSVGLYLSALARSGLYEVRGLDPSPVSSSAARRLFDIEVEVGDAHAFDRYRAFDGVALLAVLEHLRDPVRLLEKLAASMKPGAILIIEVPNADVFGAYPDIGRLSEPFGEFSNEHINFFGDATLRKLAERVGLTWIASEALPYLVGIRGLLAAFRKGGSRTLPEPVADERPSLRRYIEASSVAMRSVESRLANAMSRDRTVVLYGAGSHSARLLAQGQLADMRIEVVLDRNPHLTGRTIGGLRIALPGALEGLPARPVVVSSFHAMKSMATYLRAHFDNEIVTLYGDASLHSGCAS